nr:MAG TPA: hypothetical protein [Caudoviricetes sp.]
MAVCRTAEHVELSNILGNGPAGEALKRNLIGKLLSSDCGIR